MLSGIQNSAEIAVPPLNLQRLSIVQVVATDGTHTPGKPFSGISLDFSAG